MPQAFKDICTTVSSRIKGTAMCLYSIDHQVYSTTQGLLYYT